ncbi:histidine phosphatase family protein [uncultured Mitsuokella sp.]|uniref:histidine phosphatase family protein n=1 Tax=uncultured Mitsuokella sp. TaxID=453120 RepID=UPI0026DAC2F6|nr:histidine phosphatase family protein [uncultured Mitsuokella sp.]
MIRFILVRHGQTEWNVGGRYQGQSDVALTEEGRQQARLLAENFPVAEVHRIYASDLKRASETADIIAARFGLPVTKDKIFRELSFGDWEGLTYKEIVSRWPDAMENFLRHPDKLNIPHGETFQEVQQRAMKGLYAIMADPANEDKTIVIVAHGAILRTILTAQLHMSLEYAWSIRQFNTAVNIVRYDEGRPTVELINGTAHLGKLR